MSDSKQRIFAKLDGINGKRPKNSDVIPPVQKTETSNSLAINLAQFMQQLEAQGGTVELVPNRSTAVGAVANYLRRFSVIRKIVAGHHPGLAAMPWRDHGVLPRFGSAQARDLFGISYATAGVSETGASVVLSGRNNPAPNYFLVEHSIVLISQQELVSNTSEAWKKIYKAFKLEGKSRGVHFISGPSSTADIGFKLVAGAHGPKYFHVIIIADLLAGKFRPS